MKGKKAKKGKPEAKKRGFFLLVFISVFLLDFLTKHLIRTKLAVGEKIPIFPFFQIHHVTNTGAGFSLLQGQNELLAWLSVFVLGSILYLTTLADRKYHPWMGMVAAGIAGNLLDRLAFGYVTDFLDFMVWPVFNMADSALTIGVVMLFYYNLSEKQA